MNKKNNHSKLFIFITICFTLFLQNSIADSVSDSVLDALSKEASDTDMLNKQKNNVADSETIEVTSPETEASDELSEKITRQLRGVLGKKEEIGSSNTKDVAIEQKLENIVSSALLEGHNMSEVRDVVNEVLSELKTANNDDISIIEVNQAKEILTNITVNKNSQKQLQRGANSDSSSSLTPTTVRVEKGESLFKIALRLYGNGDEYLRLYEANKVNITDPNILQVGQILTVPK